jgi:HEAT repeat protein
MRASEAVEELVQLCEHPSGPVREDVAWALGQCGDTLALPCLIPMVYDNENRVSLTAIRAIEALGDADAAEPLISVACDPDSDEPRRQAATTCLGRLRCAPSFRALTGLLASELPSLRQASAAALRVQRNAAAVPALAIASRDVHPNVRESAVVALAELGPENAFDPVAERIDDPESTVRAAAAAALQKFAYDDAAPQLERASRDRSPEVRAAAAHTIGILRDPRSLGILEALLEDRHRVVQRALVLALARVQPSAVHDGLVVGLGSPDTQLREAVAVALGEVSHGDAEAMLLSLMTDDDPRVRQASEESLTRQRSLGASHE